MDFNRDGLAVNSVDKAGGLGLGYGYGLATMTPSGINSNSVNCQTLRKPDLQTAPKAPLAMHMQVPSTDKCLDHAGAASSGGRQCASVPVWNEAPTLATAPTRVDSTTQPNARLWILMQGLPLATPLAAIPAHF